MYSYDLARAFGFLREIPIAALLPSMTNVLGNDIEGLAFEIPIERLALELCGKLYHLAIRGRQLNFDDFSASHSKSMFFDETS